MLRLVAEPALPPPCAYDGRAAYTAERTALYLKPCDSSDPAQHWRGSTLLNASGTASTIVNGAWPDMCLSTRDADPLKVADCDSTFVFNRTNGTLAVVTEAPGAVEVREDAVQRLATAVGQVSSELGAAPTEVEQACHLPLVADGLPCLGPVPGVDGAFVATGAGCWGVLLGPATGLAMSELILDGRAICVDLTPFDPTRL